MERILSVLHEHPKLKTILLDLLSSIKQNRIIVIESGYMGTIPMMLKALDDILCECIRRGIGEGKNAF